MATAIQNENQYIDAFLKLTLRPTSASDLFPLLSSLTPQQLRSGSGLVNYQCWCWWERGLQPASASGWEKRPGIRCRGGVLKLKRRKRGACDKTRGRGRPGPCVNAP